MSTATGAVRALFISDLHLDPARPAITELFLAFLQETFPNAAMAGEHPNPPELFILGDLFEAWVGDDDDSELPQQVADALSRVAALGTKVHFIRGNRDFLLGSRFAQRAGMRILPDPCVVPLAGEPVLLLHGDLLCWDDVKYLAARRMMRAPDWQAAMLARPLAERRLIAQAARKESAAHQGSMALDVGDATNEAVADFFRRFGVTRMIHGHTHRPAIHDTHVDGQPHQRIVLGDWYEQGSVLRLHEDGHYELSRLPLR